MDNYYDDEELTKEERETKHRIDRMRSAYASGEARWRPLLAELPPEIAEQLDQLIRCNSRTLMGQCQWPVIRGETFCLEHSQPSTRPLKVAPVEEGFAGN